MKDTIKKALPATLGQLIYLIPSADIEARVARGLGYDASLSAYHYSDIRATIDQMMDGNEVKIIGYRAGYAVYAAI